MTEEFEVNDSIDRLLVYEIKKYTFQLDVFSIDSLEKYVKSLRNKSLNDKLNKNKLGKALIKLGYKPIKINNSTKKIWTKLKEKELRDKLELNLKKHYELTYNLTPIQSRHLVRFLKMVDGEKDETK